MSIAQVQQNELQPTRLTVEGPWPIRSLQGWTFKDASLRCWPSWILSNQSIVGWTHSPYTTLAPNKYTVGTDIEYILYLRVLVEQAIKKTLLPHL